MEMLKIYGIGSCDSCRQARRFLDSKNVNYEFHDFRVDGLDMQSLERWAKRMSWEELLNKRSLTWRKVPETDRIGMNVDKALALMLDQPTLIKRPVIEAENYISAGFSERELAQFIKKNT